MAQINIEKINLAGMDMLEFNIQAGKEKSNNDYTINQKATVEHDPELTFILIRLTISCSQVSENKSVRSANGLFDLRFFFTVNNLQDLMVEVTNHEFPIPDPQLAATLTGIAYSTARGVLWTRTVGTALEGFMLPIIDPMKLLIESSQIEFVSKKSE